jgi:hypothetical protein
MLKLLRDLLLISGITIVLAQMSHAENLVVIDESTDFSRFTAEQLNQEVYELDESSVEPLPPAQAIEPVTASKLKLLGRGIAPRGDDLQSLALACYDEACTTVRFVYFKSPTETYYIGSSMRNPKTESARLHKKALSVVISEYMAKHQTEATEGKRRRHFGRVFLLIVVSATAIALSLPTTGPGAMLTAGIVFTTMGGIYVLSTQVNMVELMVSGTLVEVQSSDQGGWNWSSRPKRVNAKNFNMLLGQILKGREDTDFNWRMTQEGKTDRQKERLYRQGVEF